MIIGGKEYLVPGVEIVNYRDVPRYKLRAGEDMRRRRTRWIRSFFWHNTKNRPTILRVGIGPETHLEDRISRLWSLDGRHAGAHLAVDWDATVVCMADLLEDATYHAGQVNEVSIGGELYQDARGVVYSAQLAAAVAVTEYCCRFFGIQRQCPPPGARRVIPRMLFGGRDCVGVFGHCHAYAGKADDPGVHIFQALIDAGFMGLEFASGEDLNFWRLIQRQHGLDPDGVPGPGTCDTLQAAGYAYGLWTAR